MIDCSEDNDKYSKIALSNCLSLIDDVNSKGTWLILMWLKRVLFIIEDKRRDVS